MNDRSDLDAAFDRLIEAARAHLAAVRAAGGRTEDDAVWQSYVALNNASFDYDERLLDEYGEVTPWDVEMIDPADADRRWDSDAPAPDRDQRPVTVSVRQRRDYTVPNAAALLRAAEVARSSAPYGEGSGEPVTEVGQAVAELMHAGDGSLAALDLPELEPLGGVVTVTEVTRPLGPAELDDPDDGAPFRLSAEEKVLYRYDEHVDDEAADQ
jgi:hypothetical protein